MPELPEVESVRLSLVPHLVGRRVVAARLRRRDVLRVEDGEGERAAPRGGAEGLLLSGARIVELQRHGKQLAMMAEGIAGERAALVVHLGMTGQLFCEPQGARPAEVNHVHAEWRLDSGARVYFRDARRFGGLWALASEEALGARWARLGPDALTISAAKLGARLARTERAIKAALLDQFVLAGVGNIYADESLFAAGVRPTVRASRLKVEQVERLAGAIREVLARAIVAGGSSLGDGTYVDGDGRAGRYQRAHAVYGRAGQACVVCGTRLRSAVIGGRTSVWCGKCQGGARS